MSENPFLEKFIADNILIRFFLASEGLVFCQKIDIKSMEPEMMNLALKDNNGEFVFVKDTRSAVKAIYSTYIGDMIRKYEFNAEIRMKQYELWVVHYIVCLMEKIQIKK